MKDLIDFTNSFMKILLFICMVWYFTWRKGFLLHLTLSLKALVILIWDKVFKNGPSRICGRQPLKNFKRYGLRKETISLQIFLRLSSTNFTWFILEYFVPFMLNRVTYFIQWLISFFFINHELPYAQFSMLHDEIHKLFSINPVNLSAFEDFGFHLKAGKLILVEFLD